LSTTVQVLEAPELRLLGLHDRAVTCMGATRVKLVVWEVKFKMPVMAAFWVMGSVPEAVAVKVAVVAPAGTVTEAGTVSWVLLSRSAIGLPPAGAA